MSSLNWEQRYQDGDMPWEKGAPAPGLIDFLAAQALQGSVLVPGCGFGHDARALAVNGADVTAIDLAPTALKEARRLGRHPRIRFLRRDLFQLPEGWKGQFDWVWEHTCFCAITPDQRPAYAEAMVRILKPGGVLAGVFYVDPKPDPDPPPFSSTLEELHSVFDPWFELERQWQPGSCYPGREGVEWMCLYRKRSGLPRA